MNCPYCHQKIRLILAKVGKIDTTKDPFIKAEIEATIKDRLAQQGRKHTAEVATLKAEIAELETKLQGKGKQND